MTPLVDSSLDKWCRVLAVKLDGFSLWAREAARRFVAQGTGCSVVAVASTIIHTGY